jgi:branched-chain amino acid transport system permease protein
VKLNTITNNKKTTGLIVLLVIIGLIPLFIPSPYYLDLIIIWMLNSVLAMTFLIMLRTGLISMAISAFYGIGAYASAMLVVRLGWSFWLSLPASAIITMIFALILALPLIKNTGFTFVILTTVIGMVFGVAVGNIEALGAYNGISNIPPPNPILIPFLSPIGFESKISFFYLALFLCLICVLIIKAFYAAWTGRAWTAIGLNQRLAESLGINVFRYKLIGFVLASGVAGLLGSYFAHYQSFVQPDTFNIFVTIYLQIYAILGGVGYAIAGPIFGTAILSFIPEFLRITREYGTVFVGALVIILILFLPRGLLSLFEKESVLAWLKRMGEAIGLKSTGESKRGTNDT